MGSGCGDKQSPFLIDGVELVVVECISDSVTQITGNHRSAIQVQSISWLCA